MIANFLLAVLWFSVGIVCASLCEWVMRRNRKKLMELDARDFTAFIFLPFLLSMFHPSWTTIALLAGAFVCYYGVCKYFIICFNDPRDRLFETTWFYECMEEHYDLHYKHRDKNFNIVVPLGDFFFGTLVLK